MVRQIATEVPGIDAIVFGHTHQQLASLQIGDVLLMQPKNWGISLGRHGFRPGAERNIRMEDCFEVQPVDSGDARDSGRPQDSRNRPALSRTRGALSEYGGGRSPGIARFAAGSRGRHRRSSTPSKQVQLFYSKADVSFASSFNSRVSVPKGPVTIRQIAALYVYENQLYVVEGNGKMVRDALENSARYYNTCASDCTHGPLINPHVIGYNYDMAQGRGLRNRFDATGRPAHPQSSLAWQAAGRQPAIAHRGE